MRAGGGRLCCRLFLYCPSSLSLPPTAHPFRPSDSPSLYDDLSTHLSIYLIQADLIEIKRTPCASTKAKTTLSLFIRIRSVFIRGSVMLYHDPPPPIPLPPLLRLWRFEIWLVAPLGPSEVAARREYRYNV